MKLDIKQRNEPPVDESEALETQLAMLLRSLWAAEQTVAHWWLAIPIRVTHQDLALMGRVTKQNHRSANPRCPSKHGCHTPWRPSQQAKLGKKETHWVSFCQAKNPDSVDRELKRYRASFSPTFAFKHCCWKHTHLYKYPLQTGFCLSCLLFVCEWTELEGAGQHDCKPL